MSVKILLFKSWRRRFMRCTHPKKGNKIAFRFEDVNIENLDMVRQILADIATEKHMEYALIYTPSSFERDQTPRVFVFNELVEFPKAVRKLRGFMLANHPEYVFPLWVGGHTLFVLVEINDETLPTLKRLQEKSVIPKNYTGRRL